MNVSAAPLLRIIAVTATLFAFSASAFAAPGGDPKAVVEVNYKDLSAMTEAAQNQADINKGVRKMLEGVVDYDLFSARTLKGTWQGLSDADKERFKDKFTALVIKTYAKRFKPKTKFSVEYRKATTYADDKASAKVYTVVKSSKIAADVDYLFKPTKADKWRAADIIIDGVSMALNWRKSFRRIIKKSGFDALLARIDKQLAKK